MPSRGLLAVAAKTCRTTRPLRLSASMNENPMVISQIPAVPQPLSGGSVRGSFVCVSSSSPAGAQV